MTETMKQGFCDNRERSCSTAARDNRESATNEIMHAVAVKDEEEADRAIQQLNEQGLGVDMSHEEYLSYHNKLPCPSHVDTKTKLHGVELNELEIRLALHRFNYVKWLKKTPKNESPNDKLKDDYLVDETFDCVEEDVSKVKEKCTLDFLEENIETIKEDGSKLLVFLGKHGFFKHFEKDGTLDWFFHPEHCALACLDDYQRLVPRNFGGFEYVNWNEYRRYFHSYEIEKEYVQYCEELSEKLKWMEGYVLMKPSSRTWRRVFTRGNDQATMIAAGFSKITWRLASNGYHEVLDNMSFDVCWYKELDCVYFEVWQRITKLKKSFRDALEDVYNLNKFPLRQSRMKRALETDCSKMEKEFCTCTEGITGEVTDQRAQELIAEAVRKLKEKPKFYEHYIKKKMSVARVIGLIRYKINFSDNGARVQIRHAA
ncbi:hypothetical protein EJB05_17125, partial [Eragrostis curvula]